MTLKLSGALDPVIWSDFLWILKKFGFGNNFRKWVILLCENPTAEIVTNKNIYKPNIWRPFINYVKNKKSRSVGL